MAMKDLAKPSASEAGAKPIKSEPPEGNPARRFPHSSTLRAPEKAVCQAQTSRSTSERIMGVVLGTG